MSKDPTQKLFEYIAALENTNEELVKTLKKCVELYHDIHLLDEQSTVFLFLVFLKKGDKK